MIGPDGRIEMSSTGLVQRVERPERDIDALIKPGEHLWTALTAHLVLDPMAIAEGRASLHLDAESLLFTRIGCYVCEEPFSKRVAHRSCRGEPKT